MSDALSDAGLIIAARAGDEEAYAQLYRRHSRSALRFARSLAAQTADAEDLVSEAFARVLAALRGGTGPNEAFRPYVLSAVRNAFYDAARKAAREHPVGDLSPLAPAVPFVDPVTATEEGALVATAFGELPERWQVVLWHTEVEGEKPADAAPLLGISANAVSALAFRAREGLRERYLQAHVGSATDERCRPTAEKLAAYTRHKLSRTHAGKVRAHLEGCARCRVLFAELADVNARLGALLAPVVLGGAAAAHLAASGADGASGRMGVLRRVAQRRAARVGGGLAVVAGLVVLALFLISQRVPDEVSSPPTPPVVASPAPTRTPTPTSTAGETSGPTPPLVGPTPSFLARVGVTATLEPVGALVRGRSAVLLLTVTNPTVSGAGTVTATFTLPDGVTLRDSDAGDGWTCTGTGAVTCTHADLPPGQTTRAHVRLSVAPGAADGVPSVRLTGPGLVPLAVAASQGVVNSGLGAVMAARRPASVMTVGNSLLSCPSAANGCVAARGGAPFGADNDRYEMIPYVDPFAPPGAPGGAAVSGATLAVREEVVWAGLYWAGTGAPPDNPTAYVRPPGGGSYQPLPATQVHQVPAGWIGQPAYQVSVDVTGLVRSAAPTGTWWVAVSGDAFTLGRGAFGGWALVVVVDAGGPVRTVAVFDGAVAVESAAPLTSTVYGLAGGVATVGLVAWDGDRGRGGDMVTLDGAPLDGSRSNWPSRGSGNLAASTANGTPPGWNTFGTHARVLTGRANGLNPVLTATGGDDTWIFGVLAIATGP